MRLAARPRARKWLIAGLLAMALIGVARQVEASQGIRGDRCEVAEDVQINEDFYFFCRILDIRGTIDGDLIGVAAEITIRRSAVVTGDLWVGGGKLVIEGMIGDDVHFAGLTIALTEDSRFARPGIDVAAVAINAEIMKNAVLPGDLLVYGYQANVAGTVGGDVDFRGEALLIDGVVSGQVDADVGDARRSADVPSLPIYDLSFEDPGLWIGANAHIGHDVTYTSPAESLIPPGVVKGRVRFTQTGGRPDITKAAQTREFAEILVDYIRQSLWDMVTLMILGVIGLALVPEFIRQPAQQVRQRTVPTIGWGLISFMLSIPVVIIVVASGLLLVLVLYLVNLNSLTILVGVGLLIATSALVGAFSFLLFFMGRVVVSYMLGELLALFAPPLAELTEFRQRVITLALGALAYTLLIHVPVPAMGLIIELITALAGVGAVVMRLRGVANTLNLPPARAAVVTVTPLAIPPAAPRVSLPAPDSGQPPGLDNLPDGFKGFDEDW
jgi:hypothetical protein